MTDAYRNPTPGDTVVLIDLPAGLLAGLPDEDQLAILEMVGKPVRLNEYDENGRAELEFTDRQGKIHYIYVKSDAIRIA